MKTEEISRYLAAHPEFFDQFPHLLTDLRVSHPFDGRAISIAERQILNLRDKVILLESKLAELIRFGEENDSISQKLHHITTNMMNVVDIAAFLQTLYVNLRDDFAIDQVAMRIWSAVGDENEYSPCSDAVKSWIENMPHPQCGAYLHTEALTWLGDGEQLRSYAAIPLKNQQTIGVLVLGSTDGQRFYPQMGTVYLQRLGQLIAAGLQRLLP